MKWYDPRGCVASAVSIRAGALLWLRSEGRGQVSVVEERERYRGVTPGPPPGLAVDPSPSDGL